MYHSEIHHIKIKTISDLFTNINNRNKPAIVEAITSGTITECVDVLEQYTFITATDASVNIVARATAGEFTRPSAAGTCQLCFSLAQLCSVLLCRDDLIEQFHSLVASHKVYSPPPVGVVCYGGALLPVY